VPGAAPATRLAVTGAWEVPVGDAYQFIQGVLFRFLSHVWAPSLRDFFLSSYALWNPLSPSNEELSTTVGCYICVK